MDEYSNSNNNYLLSRSNLAESELKNEYDYNKFDRFNPNLTQTRPVKDLSITDLCQQVTNIAAAFSSLSRESHIQLSVLRELTLETQNLTNRYSETERNRLQLEAEMHALQNRYLTIEKENEDRLTAINHLTKELNSVLIYRSLKNLVTGIISIPFKVLKYIF